MNAPTLPPSKDLVAKLRNWYHDEESGLGDAVLLMGEAAAVIERLQDALRTAIDSRNAWSYPRTTLEPASGLLFSMRDWIESAPHGDNCFVTDEYPGNQCVCGKESLSKAMDDSFGVDEPSESSSTAPMEIVRSPDEVMDWYRAGTSVAGLADWTGHWHSDPRRNPLLRNPQGHMNQVYSSQPPPAARDMPCWVEGSTFKWSSDGGGERAATPGEVVMWAEIERLRASPPQPSPEQMAEPHSLTGYAERQLDAIDASVFSGDTYANDEGRARFAWYMGRWCRELGLTPGVQPSPTKGDG